MDFILNVIQIGLIVYLLIAVSNLKKKTASLKTPQTAQLDERVEKETSKETPAIRTPAVAVNNNIPDKDVVGDFFNWFAKDWPFKVGAIFILLGVGWFLTYAFVNNLIGPVGRLGIGLGSGAIVMVLGNLRIKKNIYQGEILASLGAGILLATVFASEYAYTDLVRALYPRWVSLLLVTCVVGALTFTSFINKTMRLAALAFLVGVLAPVIIGNDRNDVVLIFGYLLALTLGLIWLVRLTGWRILIIMPLSAVIIFTLFYRFSASLTPDQTLWIQFFAVTFTCIFYLSTLMAFAYEKSKDNKDMLIGVLFSLYCFIWVVSFVSAHNRSIVLVTFALVFMTGAFILSKLKSVDYAVYLYFVVSVVFLVTATFLEIKTPGLLPVVLSIEAILLFIFADRVYGLKPAQTMSILFIPPVALSIQLFTAYSGVSANMYLNNYFDPMQNGYVPQDSLGAVQKVTTYSLQLVVINAVLYAGAVYAYLYRKHAELREIGKFLFVAAAVYSLYFVWSAFPYYLKQLQYGFDGKIVVLIIFAVIGLFTYFYGIHENRLWTKRFGFVLSCFVIGRLLLFEIWSMSIPAKIVTFIVVGIIFMLSVFIQFSMNEKKTK
ncbi:MAG: DUF2339 domain-containing protein [Candidatus Levybacteria bacterium]|nr:DUF2339 domain-containing protein [Candidatus Levybacteria bacterium]